MQRLQTAGKKATATLFQNANSPNSELQEKLAKIAFNYKDKIEHVVWREKKAIKSVKRLGNGPELEKVIAKFVEDIGHCGQFEIARFEENLAHVAKAVGLTVPTQLEETKAAKEAKNLTPKRLFKGTLNSDILKKELGEKEYEWYEKITEKDKDFRKKTYEILSFMDGNRTVNDIAKAVSAEYSETNIEHVLKFIHDLKKINLISFQ